MFDKIGLPIMAAIAVVVIMLVVVMMTKAREGIEGAKCIDKTCARYIYGPDYWFLTGYPPDSYISSGWFRLPHKNKVWDTDADIKQRIGMSQ